MRTEALIAMLATNASQEPAVRPWRRMGVASVFGLAISTLLMLKAIPLNPELARVMLTPEFWQKLIFSASVAGLSMFLLTRLAQPGARSGAALKALPLPALAIWILAATALIAAAPDERLALIFGKTWKVCPFLITMLAAPIFGSTFWALQELAPTRLRLAGAAAGLFAGGAGAVVYCFHCPELDAPFIGIWYLLGMLLPAAAGSALGPRLLRW